MKDKVRLWFLLLALIPAYFIVSITYRRLREEVVVDQCLSGNHGSFDYSNMSCDLETNHPYVPYPARHPRDEWAFVLALVSFAALLSARPYVKTKYGKT
jgi:hypothetical protein